MALRSLSQGARIHVVTLVTLALGIGANTAIFSVVERAYCSARCRFATRTSWCSSGRSSAVIAKGGARADPTSSTGRSGITLSHR